MLASRRILLEAGFHPSLDLDFTTEVTDSLITYTSGGAKTYFDASDTMQTAAANVWPLEYAPTTGACLGRSIWQAATNSIRNSTRVGAVAGAPGTLSTNWGYGNLRGLTQTVSLVTVSGISVLRVRLNGSPSSTGRVFLGFDTSVGIAATVGQIWQASGYLAVSSGALTNVGSPRFDVDEYNSTPVFLTSDTGSALSLTSTLTRFSQSVTIGNASTASAVPGFAFTATNGQAVDVTFDIGAVQFERDIVTPFIPTSTVAVTRAAELASMTGAAFSSRFDPLKGMFVVRGVKPSTISGMRPVVRVDDGTDNERMSIRGNGANPEFVVVDGGATVAQIDTGTLVANTAYNVAAAYSAASCASSKDGATVVTDASVTLPTVTQMLIGSDGTNYLSGWIQSIRYSRKAANDPTLQRYSA